jgi:hypothetical protein
VPDARAWPYYNTFALQYFVKSWIPSLAPMKFGGYIALTTVGIQFWQRENGALIHMFTVPRASVISVARSRVAYGFQTQDGVTVQFHADGASSIDLPLIIQGIGPLRAWTSASAAVVKAWSAMPPASRG